MTCPLLFSIAVFALASVSRAADASAYFSITPEEVLETRYKLGAYERGVLSLEDLNEKAGENGCRKLMVYYLSYASAVPTKCKLPISRALVYFDMNAEAARLAADYAKVYSNDWHAWAILGTAYSAMNHLQEAVSAYTNAARLGYKDCYAVLAARAVDAGQLDLARDMVPELLKLQRDSATSESYRLDLTGALVLFSLAAEREDVFVKAVEGADPKAVLSRTDLKEVIERGCQKFKSKEIERISEQLRRASREVGSSVKEETERSKNEK
jgi:tetratricopeptide (TPR) repeat protein